MVQAIDLHSRQLMAQCEVTAPQLVCLHMLAMEGRLTSKALADKVRLTPSTLVGILDRLEAKGLVSRQRDQADRRAVFVDLTKRGEAFVVKAPSPLQSALLDSFRLLPRKDQQRLATSLEEVVGLMQAEELEEVPILASARFAGPGSHKQTHRPKAAGGTR
jgi:DNA-binding MarR family transcriptional regulator